MIPVSPGGLSAMSSLSGIRLRDGGIRLCSGIPLPLPVLLLEKASKESLHGKPKKRFPCCCFTRGGSPYISTSSYSLLPMPSFSAASTVWTPFLDSMRSSRWSLPGSSEAYTKSRQA